MHRILQDIREYAQRVGMPACDIERMIDSVDYVDSFASETDYQELILSIDIDAECREEEYMHGKKSMW